jgi:CRISPR/Cas system CSM-associated protein Csm3 (group 7 of RAMP superfamily)
MGLDRKFYCRVPHPLLDRNPRRTGQIEKSGRISGEKLGRRGEICLVLQGEEKKDI